MLPISWAERPPPRSGCASCISSAGAGMKGISKARAADRRSQASATAGGGGSGWRSACTSDAGSSWSSSSGSTADRSITPLPHEETGTGAARQIEPLWMQGCLASIITRLGDFKRGEKDRFSFLNYGGW
jgi:hypothetical protein